jgi:hypothetical protein
LGAAGLDEIGIVIFGGIFREELIGAALILPTLSADLIGGEVLIPEYLKGAVVVFELR